MLLSRCAARAASGALRAVVPRAVAPRVSAAPRWAAEGRRREAPAGGVVAHARGLAARARAAGKGKVRARLMGPRLRLGLGLGLGLGGGGVGQPAGRQGERSEGLAGRYAGRACCAGVPRVAAHGARAGAEHNPGAGRPCADVRFLSLSRCVSQVYLGADDEDASLEGEEPFFEDDNFGEDEEEGFDLAALEDDEELPGVHLGDAAWAPAALACVERVLKDDIEG